LNPTIQRHLRFINLRASTIGAMDTMVTEWIECADRPRVQYWTRFMSLLRDPWPPRPDQPQRFPEPPARDSQPPRQPEPARLQE
jgi:hypothetical protein